MSMTNSSPPKEPTADIVQAYGKQFDDGPRTGPNERALTWLFGSYPANVDPRHVLVKVVALNGTYSTNVFAVTEMAAHIRGLGIDPALAAGDLSVVDRVARFPFTGDRHYSFATKYCSFHQPERFPIYDNLVERLLWSYQVHSRFGDFARADLLDYPSYVAVLRSFLARFDLGGMTFKQVDKFLWLHARELYPRKASEKKGA